MRPYYIIFGVALVSAAAAADLDLRAQLRSDTAELIRTHNPRLAADPEKFVSAIDEALRSLEEDEPGILAPAPEATVPNREQIAKALQACGELPRSEFWLFYSDRWAADRLTSSQKILFHRFLTTRAEKMADERRKRERRNG